MNWRWLKSKLKTSIFWLDSEICCCGAWDELMEFRYKMKVSVDDSVKLESLMQLSTDCINSKLPAACEYTRAEKRPMMEELRRGMSVGSSYSVLAVDALAHTLEETARGMRETITDPEGRFMALGEARWAVADQVRLMSMVWKFPCWA